ncbi:helix-turn-helix domain-containing protein [Candidatus Liberibacter asiaticus]|uniref:helix-turn-helix domain-containing protein n=1 Tax=Liberibacter asiaticus TaxID=34021 RepID=UPI00234BD523|nr:helix-turn-helix transcriptional regulator [Candidatus Liberibacter asiaticus]WCM58436.1 helix-turn-helix domain-containing protein [Candidatus Liberibacter asiaticus]
MRIRDIRKSKGKTLEELAIKAGTIKSAINSFEKGRNPTYLKVLSGQRPINLLVKPKNKSRL